MTGERADLDFVSGGASCAAWLYRAEGDGLAPIVVMAHGFSLTRHDGLEPYAERFAAAGLNALVFDHRYLGDSDGEPRQRFRVADQLEDWRNAIKFARGLDGIDSERLVLWGYSFSGGHVTTLLAEGVGATAALILCPLVNGLARVLATKPRDSARILPRAVMDAAGRHVTIPVTGEPGELGAMTFEGEADGFARAVAPDSPWRNEISPGVFLGVARLRQFKKAGQIHCPLWVGFGERDITVDNAAVEKLATRAPRGELHSYDADHFDPFVDPWSSEIGADQVNFLRRAGLAASSADG